MGGESMLLFEGANGPALPALFYFEKALQKIMQFMCHMRACATRIFSEAEMKRRSLLRLRLFLASHQGGFSL